MWRVIGYRRLQALTVLLLAALVSACAGFGPLYYHSSLDALARLSLARAPAQDSGLTLSSTRGTFDEDTPYGLDDMLGLLPTSLRDSFGSPIRSTRATAVLDSGVDPPPTGPLLWRQHACRHLTVTAGRCPSASGEIAVSTADARNFELHVGARVAVPVPGNGVTRRPLRLRVVGVYRQRSSPTWFGIRLTGSSGVVLPGEPSELLHDTWVTPRATFDDAVPLLTEETNTVDLPYDARGTGLEELFRIGPQVGALPQQLRDATQSDQVTVRSALPDIATTVVHQRTQSRVIVPLLLTQTGLLVVVVLWLVLAAATEQRRPEVALALLRGHGRSGARRLLNRELGPVVLAGVPVGAMLAVGLDWVARHLFLPAGPTFALGWPFWLAVVGSAVLLVLVTASAVRLATRDPVDRLLRRVPVRRSGWAVGATEAVVLAVSATAVLAFVTGGLSGPLAYAAPALLAVLVGLLLAHAVAPLASRLGRRLLRHGRWSTALWVLDAARSPTTRRTVTVVTIASALLVFAADAVVVGVRNRTVAAEQDVGAARVVDVRGNDLPAVRRALARVDPDGRTFTPTVTAYPPDNKSSGTIAVDPAGFGRIALAPDGDPATLRLDAVAPSDVRPVRLTGERLRGQIRSSLFASGPPGPDSGTPPLDVELQVLDRNGSPARIPLGPAGSTDGQERSFSAQLPCDRACTVTGVTVRTLPASTVQGRLTLSRLSTPGGGQVDLGPRSSWQPLAGLPRDQEVSPRLVDGDMLSFDLASEGLQTITLRHRWLPSVVPAVVAGGEAPVGSGFEVVNLDGIVRPAREAARVRRIPGADRGTVLVDLDVVLRGTTRLAPYDQVAVWSRTADPAVLARLRSALAEQKVAVRGSRTVAGRRAAYDASTAAWSLDLGVVTAAVGLLLAVLTLVVLASTGWRSRSRDLAALQVAGLGRRPLRRVAVRSSVLAVLLAVLAGAVCGVVGARVALPSVPLFAEPPEISTLDLGAPWPVVLAAVVVTAAFLGLTAWLAGRGVARRATPDRIREVL